MTKFLNEEQVDSRTLCQLTSCGRKAMLLVAWPASLPVALCHECWDAVRSLPFSRPAEWKRWLTENSKSKERRHA